MELLPPKEAIRQAILTIAENLKPALVNNQLGTIGNLQGPSATSVTVDEANKTLEARRASLHPRLFLVPDIDPTWTIYQRATKAPPRTWEEVFITCDVTLQNISRMTDNGHPYLPFSSEVFAAYDLTPLDKVKVVMLGQDPYHQITDGIPSAMGLAFSCRKGRKIEASLSNILTEVRANYPHIQPPREGGDLTPWAKQGVFLLNSCLTVTPGIPNSHGDRYIPFIKATLRAVVAHNPNTIFVLWGAKARAAIDDVGVKEQNILTCAHPSPISVKGFWNNKHFLKVNEKLRAMGQTEIDWSLP